MSIREAGRYQTFGDLSYFIPYALPPTNPPLSFNTEMMSIYGEASFELGQLNEMCLRLPDPERFINAYVMKEALLSSAIEGIHTTLVDVLTPNFGHSKRNKDTQLVLNYKNSLKSALSMLKDEGLPLVTRVILRSHEVLMSIGEGDKASPGLFRKQSVRVGDLIPPPAQEVPSLMSGLEKYMNEPSDMPALIKAGLTHVHFETIHPFLDGNGRIGRLLIVLMLIENGLLALPVLYPSYYFKKNHSEYYKRLDRVRTHGDFEGWLTYYLKAIRDSAKDAHTRAKEIEGLTLELQDVIQTDESFVKMRNTADLALNFLFIQPITGIVEMSQKIGKAYNTTHNILKEFIKLGIVSEHEFNNHLIKTYRYKIYCFKPYLDLLQKEYV